MSILKSHMFKDNFEEKSSSNKVVGNVLKSSKVFSSGSSVSSSGMPIESASVSTDDDFSFDDGFDDFDEPAPIEEVPVTVSAQPVATAVDESQVRASVMEELQAHFDDLLNAISGLKEARNSVIESAQSQLIEMAILIAEKVIQQKVESDPNLINSVIEGTFDKISGSDRIIFKINPADSEAVTSFQSTIESRLVGVEKISIQQDSTIEPGGCIIETDLGFVDVTIQEKMNLIVQTFKKLKSTL